VRCRRDIDKDLQVVHESVLARQEVLVRSHGQADLAQIVDMLGGRMHARRAEGAVATPGTGSGMDQVCDSVEAFLMGYSPRANEMRADRPNFTDIAPVMQIREVVVGQ
jgi:hypothetical protein